MRIIRNYILKEIAEPTTASIFIFTFVLIVGNLIKLADLVINKGVDIIRVAKLFILLIPYTLSYTIPMAMLTGTLLGFGRLSQDNELAAMRSGGLSAARIASPILIIGFILSLVCVIVNDRVLPYSSFLSRRLIKEIGLKTPSAYLEAGTFIKDFEGHILFIYNIEGDKLYKIRIYQPQANRPTRTIIAEKGEFVPSPITNSIKLKLIDGSSDEPSQTEPGILYKLLFKTYYITLRLPDKMAQTTIDKKPKDMTIKELRQDIEKLKSQGVDVMPLYVSLHKRIAMSFSTFAFVCVALPLGIIVRRKERSIGFGIALFLIVAYYLLLAGSTALALNGTLDVAFSMWLANILFIATGTILMCRVARM